MSILIDEKTPVIVQGIIGKAGKQYTEVMKKFGTNIVAGVSPSADEQGKNEILGVAVFKTVKEALDSYKDKSKKKVEWSIMFVLAESALKAATAALNNNLNLVIATKGVPVHDIIKIINLANEKKKIVIGPNCQGIICPGKSMLGTIPNNICIRGNIGVISRNEKLTCEILTELKNSNIGVSTAVEIGSDLVIGSDFLDILNLFEKDNLSKAIVLIGNVDGEFEESAAEYIKGNIKKPVIAYFEGFDENEGQHKNKGVKSKIEAFKNAGVTVAKKPSSIVKFLKELK